MANRTNISCKSSTSASAAGVDNLVENAFVPEAGQVQQKPKWDVLPIVSHAVHTEVSGSLFDSIDALVEQTDKHIPSGPAFVYLLGCDLYHSNEDGKEFLRLLIKDKETGAEESVALFPGNEYTDMYGTVHAAGHNWMAWAEEVKQQFNSRHLPFSRKGGLVDVIHACVNSGFNTWLLDDGKYLNMYATEKKYLAALKKLAAEKQKGHPNEKMLDEVQQKVEAQADLSKNDDDKPPFIV